MNSGLLRAFSFRAKRRVREAVEIVWVRVVRLSCEAVRLGRSRR